MEPATAHRIAPDWEDRRPDPARPVSEFAACVSTVSVVAKNLLRKLSKYSIRCILFVIFL